MSRERDATAHPTRRMQSSNGRACVRHGMTTRRRGQRPKNREPSSVGRELRNKQRERTWTRGPSRGVTAQCTSREMAPRGEEPKFEEKRKKRKDGRHSENCSAVDCESRTYTNSGVSISGRRDANTTEREQHQLRCELQFWIPAQVERECRI